MKKVFLIIFLFLFLILVIPINANAACPTEGLVPCGTEGCPCQFCHFFVLFDNIVRFVLFNLVPPIAVLMLVIAGVMFFTATGSPEKINEANKIITSVVYGLLIIFGAWIIVNTVFMFIGVTNWTGLTEGWFQIDCPIIFDSGCVLLPPLSSCPPEKPNMNDIICVCCCPSPLPLSCDSTCQFLPTGPCPPEKPLLFPATFLPCVYCCP